MKTQLARFLRKSSFCTIIGSKLSVKKEIVPQKISTTVDFQISPRLVPIESKNQKLTYFDSITDYWQLSNFSIKSSFRQKSHKIDFLEKYFYEALQEPDLKPTITIEDLKIQLNYASPVTLLFLLKVNINTRNSRHLRYIFPKIENLIMTQEAETIKIIRKQCSSFNSIIYAYIHFSEFPLSDTTLNHLTRLFCYQTLQLTTVLNLIHDQPKLTDMDNSLFNYLEDFVQNYISQNNKMSISESAQNLNKLVRNKLFNSPSTISSFILNSLNNLGKPEFDNLLKFITIWTHYETNNKYAISAENTKHLNILTTYLLEHIDQFTVEQGLAILLKLKELSDFEENNKSEAIDQLVSCVTSKVNSVETLLFIIDRTDMSIFSTILNKLKKTLNLEAVNTEQLLKMNANLIAKLPEEEELIATIHEVIIKKVKLSYTLPTKSFLLYLNVAEAFSLPVSIFKDKVTEIISNTEDPIKDLSPQEAFKIVSIVGKINADLIDSFYPHVYSFLHVWLKPNSIDALARLCGELSFFLSIHKRTLANLAKHLKFICKLIMMAQKYNKVDQLRHLLNKIYYLSIKHHNTFDDIDAKYKTNYIGFILKKRIEINEKLLDRN